MNPKQQTAAFVVIAVVSTAAIVGGIMYVVLNPAAPEGNYLEVYHWWTSGGEAAAISSLIDEFESQYPDAVVYSVQIAGGGGAQMRTKIKTLMIAGNSPDTFQIHAGYEWKIFYDGQLLEPINEIWTSAVKAAVPDVVEDMNKGPDGNYYSVPVNIHRSNVLWYNLAVLNDTGIDPATIITWTDLMDACAAVEANANFSIDHAMALGTQWTQAHAFEQIMAAQGIEAYEAWINGDITGASSPYYADLVQACIDYETMVTHTDPLKLGAEWDNALANLISSNPSAAFNIMGDWADGEFQQAGWTYGIDYGTIAVPGTNNTYGLVQDCFEKPKNIPHPTNVNRWLGVISSVAGQDAFNPSKGSIPARTDCNTSLYGDYQQSAMSDFSECDATGYFFPSVVHGSGMPESFAADLGAIIEALTGISTPAEAAAAIAAKCVTYSADFTRTWSLD